MNKGKMVVIFIALVLGAIALATAYDAFNPGFFSPTSIPFPSTSD